MPVDTITTAINSLFEVGSGPPYASTPYVEGKMIAQTLSLFNEQTTKGNFSAIIPPAVGDDSADGYSVGSLWVDTVGIQAFICMDATVGAAVWRQVADVLNNYTAIIAPAVGNDSTEGYSVGSLWVDTVLGISYVCTDNSVGAAVWKRTSTILNNFAAVIAPAVGNDDSQGYEIGSIWVDTVGIYAYICIDATTGAAVWRGITDVLNNFAAIIAPVVGNDSTEGYSVGSRWIDTVLDMHYVCMSAGVGAAIWRRTNNVFVNYAGAVPPAVGNDDTQGYEVGSIWIDAVLEIAYICTSPATGAAIWRRVTLIPGNYASATNPTINDDDTAGYEVGSVWINTTLDIIFTCVDATTGAAVWRYVPLGSYDNAAGPGVGDDIVDGFVPGSIWIDTTADDAYICLDNAAGAAVWKQISP